MVYRYSTHGRESRLNPDRLAVIPEFFKSGYLDTGKLPCMATLVSLRGEVAHESYQGTTEMAGHEPIGPDTIFRIYSMTKPITTLAIMMLFEECRIRLDHPVSRYIPEYRDVKVWDGGTAAAPRLRAPDREITVLDLVTHTSGLTYGFLFQDETDEIYRREKVGHPKDSLQHMARQIAGLPLAFSPGTEWRYSHSIDVLGALIEIIAGETLDRFFQSRIFGPLGMHDTGFFVPADQIHRLMACYQKDAKTGDITLSDPAGAASRLYATQPRLLNAGGGLVSTVRDYHRFARMLLGGGTLDGARLISPKTWAFMSQNHLPGGRTMRGMGRSAFTEVMADGVGFGLGGSVVTDIVQTHQPGSNGTFSWGGLASTYFWIDPQEELIAIQATQLIPSSTYPMRQQLQQLVYAAID